MDLADYFKKGKHIDLTRKKIFFNYPIEELILDSYNNGKSNLLQKIEAEKKSIHQTNLDTYASTAPPFVTGGATDVRRGRFKKIINENRISYCDCCGKQINLIPWKQVTTLCDTCNEQLERDCNGIFGEKRKNRHINIGGRRSQNLMESHVFHSQNSGVEAVNLW